MLKNTLTFLLLAGLFALVLIIAMDSIDKITARDCARGIADACKYIK